MIFFLYYLHRYSEMNTSFLCLSSDVAKLKNCLLYADSLISHFNDIKTHMAALKPMILSLLENNKQFLVNDAATLAKETIIASLNKKDIDLVQLVCALKIVRDMVVICRNVVPENQTPAFVVKQMVARPRRPSEQTDFPVPNLTPEELCAEESNLLREKQRLYAEMRSKMGKIKELVRANTCSSHVGDAQIAEVINRSTSLIEMVCSGFEDFVFSRTNQLNVCYSVCFYLC